MAIIELGDGLFQLSRENSKLLTTFSHFRLSLRKLVNGLQQVFCCFVAFRKVFDSILSSMTPAFPGVACYKCFYFFHYHHYEAL